MPDSGERWGIVGGGILGMTLALRLAQRGNRVTLFESAGALGGLAGAWTLGGVTWDRHYHVTLLSDTYLRAVLAELGLEQELQWTETRTGFYTGGQLYSMSNTLEFLRFPPLRMWDKLRLGATIFYGSRLKDWKPLEKIPVADWLQRLSGRRTFEKIWLPLLRAKLGENYKETSAAFIWTTIARMYAARRTGLKKEMFGYVRGGYARILDRYAQTLREQGVDIRLDHQLRRASGVDGLVALEFAGRAPETFDRAVITAAAPVAAQVCPELTDEERARLLGVRYQGIVCASLLLKKSLSNFYVTNLTDPWVPFTAVIEMSALVDKQQFHGNALVYLPKYLTPDDPTFSLSDAEIEERFVAALERMHPHFRREDVVAFRVSRVRYVVAIPTLGYTERLPSMETSIPGLYIVNSAQIVNGTLNANETIRLAAEALSKIEAAR